MRMLTVLAAFAVAIATDCSLHATPIYHYAWVPFDQGNTSPAPLGTPGSGFIDFLAPTDGGIGTGLDAISDLQFTGFSANGSGPLPDIPSPTYDLSNALSPLEGGIMWDSQRITSMGITLFNPLAPGTSSNISDHRVETFYPLAYFPNEESRTGDWLFQGAKQVSETGGNAAILMLSGAALTVFHLATRRKMVRLK
jgi:hypothetical protein